MNQPATPIALIKAGQKRDCVGPPCHKRCQQIEQRAGQIMGAFIGEQGWLERVVLLDHAQHADVPSLRG